MLYLNGMRFPDIFIPTQWTHEESCEAEVEWEGSAYQCSLSSSHDFDHVAVHSREFIVGAWSDTWQNEEDPEGGHYFYCDGRKVPLLKPNIYPFYENGGCGLNVGPDGYECTRHSSNGDHLAHHRDALLAMLSLQFQQDPEAALRAVLG